MSIELLDYLKRRRDIRIKVGIKVNLSEILRGLKKG